MSAGPTTTKVEKEFALDHEDIAIRGMMVIQDGEVLWPWTPPAPPPPPPKKEVEGPKVLTDEDVKAQYAASAKTASYGALAMLGVGMISPNPAFSNMFTTFALSGVIGYQVVWGVVPALHSPLMAVTNAISGMTAVGGMFAMGGGVLPHTGAQAMAAAATAISMINVTGGFLVTKKMLDLFKRPDDPPEVKRPAPRALPCGRCDSAYLRTGAPPRPRLSTPPPPTHTPCLGRLHAQHLW